MRWWIGILLGLFSGGLVLSFPQGTAERPRAYISGRVLSTEGKPLSRTIITARRRDGSAIFQAKTDRGGRYTLEVEPGTYYLTAEKGGYVTALYSVDGSSAEATPVTVEAGKSVTVDFRLSRGGVITGRILDEDGEPLVGASVQAERKPDEERRPVPTTLAFRGGTTDDRGIYRIYGLASGRYYVVARVTEVRSVQFSQGMAALMPQEGAPTYYPGVTSRQQAVEVEVIEGVETTGIDFKIASDKERALIFGTVRKRETGEPVPGTTVIAYSGDRPTLDARATTDEQGRYELKGLSPGTYRVQVAMGPLTQDYAAPPTQEVSVENEPIEVNFELERGAEISGRILTEDGRVPENVMRFMPFLRVKGTARLGAAASMPQVDAQGNFTLKRVPSGTLLLDVNTGDSPYFVRAVLHEDRDVTHEGITVQPGERVTDVTILLSDAGATLRGRVLASEKDEPLPGAFVQLVPLDFAKRFAEKGVLDARGVLSDQRGSYEIRGIPPGRYYLLVLSKRPLFRRPEEMLEFLTTRAAGLPILEVKMREVKQLDLRPTVKD